MGGVHVQYIVACKQRLSSWYYFYFVFFIKFYGLSNIHCWPNIKRYMNLAFREHVNVSY